MGRDLTMPLKQLSRVSPAASEGSLARAAGDRAVEKAGGSSTALFRVCLLTGGDDRPVRTRHGLVPWPVKESALISSAATNLMRPSCTARRS